ncbi:MAG TPA: hypothetical protein VHI93_07935 [Candidatus Thermoplasmatota archaeon]|nr:hypothetical protein [Candidatus Thermoplasmatota archaeon]
MGSAYDWFLHEYCPQRGLHPANEKEALDLLIAELARLQQAKGGA